MNVRPPIFASQGWYPASESACRQAIDAYLASFPGEPTGRHAGIVPHAGWVFSGKTAAWTFAAMKDAAPEVVFVFGGHMHSSASCACMPEGAFGTPLGPVPVEQEIAEELAEAFSCHRETADRFAPDNTIELQMPLIKAVWPRASVVTAQVPPNPDAASFGSWAAAAAERHGKIAVAIGSTDLTHYGANYGFTPQGAGEEAHSWSKEENDRPFVDKLLALDTAGALGLALANQSACCPGAAVAAVGFALARGVKAGKLIEHITSHEVDGHGAPRMWVGYASIVF